MVWFSVSTVDELSSRDEKNSWLSRDLNPGLLGGKQVCDLCAMLPTCFKIMIRGCCPHPPWYNLKSTLKTTSVIFFYSSHIRKIVKERNRGMSSAKKLLSSKIDSEFKLSENIMQKMALGRNWNKRQVLFLAFQFSLNVCCQAEPERSHWGSICSKVVKPFSS